METVIRNAIATDANLGYQNYIEWIKSETGDYDPETAFICFQGAEYLRQMVLNQYKTPPELVTISGSIDGFRHLVGVYHVELDNTFESHACVIFFNKEEVTIYTTYGGVTGFNITHHIKQQWVDDLLAFDRADVSQGISYFKLWGIEPDLDFVRTDYVPHVNQWGPVRITSLNYTKLA